MIVQHGIFFDGLVYSTLAYNLANETATIFNLQISDYFFNNFHEHPFLGFYLESIFFKLFGNAYYIERVYSFSVFLAVLFLFFWFWKAIYKNRENSYVWLPILFFLPLPLIFWSFTQNMLETTMTFFSLLAVYLLYMALNTEKTVQQIPLLFLSSLAIIAAFFSKGPVGIFPFATIFIYYFFDKKLHIKKALFLTLILISFTVLICLLIFQNEQLLNSTISYLKQQVLNSLQGNRDTVENRFVFLIEIVKETLPLIIITTLLYITHRKKVLQDKNDIKQGVFFIAIGLSASLPIMISTKQYGFYLVPSMPYFSLGFAILALPYVKYLVNKISYTKYLLLLFSLLFILSLLYTLTKIGEYSRDAKRLKDLKRIAKSIEPVQILNGEPSMNNDFSLNSYFMRYYNITLNTSAINEKYLLVYKKSKVDAKNLQEYKKSDIDLNVYYLYEKSQ